MLACDWALFHWFAVIFPTTFLPNPFPLILLHPIAALLVHVIEPIVVVVRAAIFRYGAEYGSFCGVVTEATVGIPTGYRTGLHSRFKKIVTTLLQFAFSCLGQPGTVPVFSAILSVS